MGSLSGNWRGGRGGCKGDKCWSLTSVFAEESEFTRQEADVEAGILWQRDKVQDALEEHGLIRAGRAVGYGQAKEHAGK